MKRRVAGWAVLVCTLALLSGACQSQDITKATLDADVTTVYANLLARRDALLGNPPRSGVRVAANCYRGGPKQPDVGAGKDWRCDVTETDASSDAASSDAASSDAVSSGAVSSGAGGPNPASYLLIVGANACWTALAESLSARAETVNVITMTDPGTGADLADPLGGFDGCVRA